MSQVVEQGPAVRAAPRAETLFHRTGRALGRRAGLLRGLAAALTVAAVVLFLRTLPAEQPLTWLTARVHELGAAGPVLFGLLFVAFTVLLLPATPVMLAAGAVFGPVEGAVVISLASTVSAALSFLAARSLGRGWAARRVDRSRTLGAVCRALGEPGGWKLVFALRLSHALPLGLQNFLLGLTPVRLGPYLLASWLALLPGAVLYAYLGYIGARALAAESGNDAAAGPWVLRGLALVAAAGALLYVVRLARRAVRRYGVAEPGERAAAGMPWGALAALLAAGVLLAAAAGVNLFRG